MLKKTIEKILKSDELQIALRTEQNNPHHNATVGLHTLRVAEKVGDDEILKVAALLHDLGKVDTKETVNGIDRFHGHAKRSAEIAERLLSDVDAETRQRIVTLVRMHDDSLPTEKSIRKALRKLNNNVEDLHRLLTLRKADILSQSELDRDEKLSALENTRQIVQRITQ